MTAPFQDKLTEIRSRFVAALDARGQIVYEAIISIETEENQGAALEAAQMELHKIAGTAAPLGFKELGVFAADFESRISAQLSCSELDLIALKTDLLELMETIESIQLDASPSNWMRGTPNAFA